MAKDRMLVASTLVLRIANMLNWACVVGFAIALMLSVPFAQMLLAQLASKYAGRDVAPLLQMIRWMLVGGMLCAIPCHVLFTRMRAIVATVGAGDPFVAVNARRLQAIGWALLALQFFDLGYGALTWWLRANRIDTIGWTPSIGGWIAVLMVFVLARVFTIGTRIRDDLEMTV